jgi:hypothetical protein
VVPVNNRAVEALSAVFEEAPVRLSLEQHDDLTVVVVGYEAHETRLVPVWAGAGYPQDVRRALQDVAATSASSLGHVVLVAARMSVGAARLLRESDTSWVDEQGEAHIGAPPALLLVSKARVAPSVDRGQRAGGMAWSTGSGAVAESVLCHAVDHALGRGAPQGLPLPAGREVAQQLGLSPGLVSRTFGHLDAIGWTAKSGPERGPNARRVLTDPTAMLSSWAAWFSGTRPSVVLAHGIARDPVDFVREEIGTVWPDGSWAVTGWVALEERAPWVTSIPRTTLYVEPSVLSSPTRRAALLADVGLSEVDRGARFALVAADPYVLRTVSRETGMPLVNDIRLYGDLLREGVRGADAAEHLRTTRIGF